MKQEMANNKDVFDIYMKQPTQRISNRAQS